MLAIAPACAGDLPMVLEILDEAARWLLARGIHQWESPAPPSVAEQFRGFIARGLVYLARDSASGEVVATFRIAWADDGLWQDDGAAAGYLYALAVRPAHIGQGIGVEIVEWLKELFRERGRTWLRLDCIASNRRLRGWYEALGFEYRAGVFAGDYVLALYELKLGTCETVLK
jgi:ribosomal protein S18 acetylase RimI-like enzyme